MSRDTVQGARPHVSGLELLTKLWPLVVAAAGVIGALYVGQYKLQDSQERLKQLEQNYGDHKIEATKKISELDGLARTVTEQGETLKDAARTLRRIERKVDRLCAQTKAGCGGNE